MGTLSVQPPSGLTRNLTEVFVFLRNNDQQNRIHVGFGQDDDKIALIDGEKGIASIGSKSPPSWVNVLDEINYEMTRLLEESEPDRIRSYTQLRENVIASLMLALNNLLHNFRANQSTYLKHLDNRTSNVDSFLLAPSLATPMSFSTTSQDVVDPKAEEDEELSISQIQQIMQNEHMTKEREKEVIKISKSILELNTLFKDVASLILDQGTILDRIDYNVDTSVHRIKSAYKSVAKAEQYQRSRKMEVPRQLNSDDCGVFTCIFAERASRQDSMDFETEEVDAFRKRIAEEIEAGILSSA